MHPPPPLQQEDPPPHTREDALGSSSSSSYGRLMEAVGDFKEEPAPLVHRNMASKGRSEERDAWGLVKRKRVLSDLDHRQKRACSVGVQSSAVVVSSVETKSVTDVVTGKPSVGKRKRTRAPGESKPELDAEQAFSAAQALYELFGGGPGSKRTPESCIESVQWAGKKSRSSRSKKEEDCGYQLTSSSFTSVSEVPEVLDLSIFQRHRMESPQAVLDSVNRGEEAETESEGRSTGESPDKGIELQTEHNLVSQSSFESTLVNSRAESPSSPLPFARADEGLGLKLEDEVQVRFGFHRALPMRPIKKPSMLRKPKVEEKSSESDDLKLLKVVPKQVSRRKPRSVKSCEQYIPLKVETPDFQAVSATSSLLRESIEENKCQTRPTELATLNLFDNVKVEMGLVKLETRPLQKMGSSTQGRLKTALSEAEKEVRRLRRVQANRESARQTIRRKQVLCEELAHKAASLVTEKEDLTQKVELARDEFRAQLKLNLRLKEQLAMQTGHRALFTSTNPENLETAVAMPRGLPLTPYWWAFALAQAAAAGQSMTQQANESTLGPDCNPMVAAAATMAAAINSGMGMNPNLWLALNSGLATINLFTGKVPASGQQPTFSMAPARLATTGESPAVSSRTLDIPMAAEPDRNFMLGDSYMAQNQEDSLSYLRADGVAKPEPHSMISRSQSSGNAQVAGLTTVSQSTERSHMPGLTSISHSSLLNSSPVSGMMMHSTLAPGPEGPGASTTFPFSRTSGQPNSARLSYSGTLGNSGYYPSFQSGGQGYVGDNPGLVRAQSATAALATEARRRRRELKRTKSLQSRQGQRLAKTRSL